MRATSGETQPWSRLCRASCVRGRRKPVKITVPTEGSTKDIQMVHCIRYTSYIHIIVPISFYYITQKKSWGKPGSGKQSFFCVKATSCVSNVIIENGLFSILVPDRSSYENCKPQKRAFSDRIRCPIGDHYWKKAIFINNIWHTRSSLTNPLMIWNQGAANTSSHEYPEYFGTRILNEVFLRYPTFVFRWRSQRDNSDKKIIVRGYQRSSMPPPDLLGKSRSGLLNPT